MYTKQTKAVTLGVTKEESELFERVSKYLEDIIKIMTDRDLPVLTDNHGKTVATLDTLLITRDAVKNIALNMEIDNRGNKKWCHYLLLLVWFSE